MPKLQGLNFPVYCGWLTKWCDSLKPVKEHDSKAKPKQSQIAFHTQFNTSVSKGRLVADIGF